MTIEKFACPCCGYKTFRQIPNGSYDICQVCFWEDDPIQLNNPDSLGANNVTLRQGQKNFINFGACEQTMVNKVRQPNIDEQRDAGWKQLE